MGYIGNQPFLGAVTGDNVVDGSITAQDLAPGAAVPPQTGNAGKFLTTDGTNASWDTVSEVPTQTGQNGKFLTTDGTVASWDTVSEVPTQTGQNGKFLTTDGTVASWDTVSEVPIQSGQAGKYLTTDGTTASWGALSSVRVTGITYPGNDTAVAPAGGQTVTLTGTGFVSTPMVFVDGTLAPSVSFVSSTQITFVAPAKSAGTYHLYVVNPDGATAIFVNGISYSGVPTWTTAAGSLGTYDGTFSIQLVATSDSTVTYALATGSSLPGGVTLSSGGLVSGTINSEQTFSFSVDAIDAENQETPRSFSVTIALADPFFKSNVLLLSGNGANNQTNNTFLDGSSNNFTITRNGNTTQGTFSPFSQTGWGNYFDGNGDYLRAAANAAFEFGSGDFTVECWVYAVKQTNTFCQTFVSKGLNTSTGAEVWFIQLSSTGYLGFNSGNGGAVAINDSVLFPLNQWTHVAAVRNGGTFSLYKNGTLVGTASATAVASGGDLYIGGQWYDPAAATRATEGYISNVRVVKGTAVYTSNFTPSTTPLTAITNTSLLTCQSNRFRDASANNFAITRNGDVSVQAFSPFAPTAQWSAATHGGSAYFDGSGDYLTLPSNAAFGFGTGDFTVEAWVYTVTATQYAVVIGGPAGGSTWYLEYSSTRGFYFYDGGAAALNGNSAVVITRVWRHLAVSRSGSTLRMFVDGVLTASHTSSTNVPQIAPTIGAYSDGTYNFHGHITGLRVVKGTAVYTAAFTPPTAPLTAVSGTSLLTNFTNAGIYDATSKNDLETVGNAQISTTQSKFGGSSMYFDGTGDYLAIPSGQNLAFGTGDFTVECWVRFDSTADFPNIFSTGTFNTSQFTLRLSNNTAKFQFYAGNAATVFVTGTTTVAINTWYHVAVARYSGTTKLYVNGVSEGTDSNAFTYLSSGTAAVGEQIGNADGMQGYIADLRITKGYARYTSNFTPPTTAHKLR